MGNHEHYRCYSLGFLTTSDCNGRNRILVRKSPEGRRAAVRNHTKETLKIQNRTF